MRQQRSQLIFAFRSNRPSDLSGREAVAWLILKKGMEKKAIIIGAGPAGLTAAYELLTRTDIKPVILEKSGDIGGISKTVNYKGNRIDIGGHRFFSKSDRVMNWWLKMMPLAAGQDKAFDISYHNQCRKVNADSGAIDREQPSDPDKVMLVRQRLSRIYFLRKFFSYPVQLSIDTLRKLGLTTTIAILFSYLKAQLSPRRPEKSLEDFMINRFGQVLYKLFFRDYTQKVWGVPCGDIPAEWGAQRIKGVSVAKAIQHAIRSATGRNSKGSLSQKNTETSLIEQFLYPKLGPGQLWEEVARQVESMGGVIHMNYTVEHIYNSADATRVTAVTAVNTRTGESLYLEGDYFFSTMPVKELIAAVDGAVPENVRQVAAGLQYRDFITVGILLKQLSFEDKTTGEWNPLELKDTWIYIQDNDVTVGRLQIFNNWSPYMVNIPGTVWIGMEFFCNTTDAFWNLPDDEIKTLAVAELEKIGLATAANVMDATVLRMEKTYPAYFGAYEHFDQVRAFTDQLENLFLIGRNGMHKYNNSDHSMLTAMVAVDNIAAGVTDKANIWAINTEQQYHEEKTAQVPDARIPELEEPFYDPEKTGFSQFVLGVQKNRKMLWTAAVGMLIQFVIFKLLYPFPDFFSDSYSYIYAAATGLNTNIWPIGYSKFLAVVHWFTYSDTMLVALQYLLVQLGALYFFFTLLYFYKPRVATVQILYYGLFFNPLMLYISNYVSSDSLFLALSLLWIGQLLWIINRAGNWQVLSHALLLAIAFTVRYNAMYYPLITALAYLISRRPRWAKLAGIALPTLLIFAFVTFTRQKNYEMTGHRQFSVFSGWQLANNALYMYPHIKVDTAALPEDTKQLNLLAKKFFDTIPPKIKAVISPSQGAFFIKYPTAPLKEYAREHYDETKDSTGGIKSWGSVSGTFATFGKHMMQQYPGPFTRHYLLPNTWTYLLPPLEKLEIYNLGLPTIQPVAGHWFHYATLQVRAISPTIQGVILFYFPLIFLVVNLVLLVGAIWLMLAGGLPALPLGQRRLVLLVGVYLLVNMAFSIFSSPVVFRYQVLPLIAGTVLVLQLLPQLRNARIRKWPTILAAPSFLRELVPAGRPAMAAKSQGQTFTDFVLRSPENRLFLIGAFIVLVLQFCILKMFYPYANYMPDSYYYLEAAWNNSDINTWPVGYSKFLRVFSAITRSDLALVFFQYIFLQGAILYFTYTLIYFLKPSKLIQYILLSFFILNPIILFTSNYISADALFTGLSLIWAVQLIWLLVAPTPKRIWLQAIILLLAFTVRYNALFYPFIAAGVLLLAKISWRSKLVGIGLTAILLGAFIWHNGNKYQQLSGHRQFSGFGGWQLAANGLFAYSHVKGDKEAVPAKFTLLQKVVRKHLDSLDHVKLRPDSTLGIYYLWSGPLREYVKLRWKNDTITPYFKQWATVAPLYAEYGQYLIRKHPAAYFKYFILPNAENYSVPPPEFLNVYNMGRDTVNSIAQQWFGYKSTRIKRVSKDISFMTYLPTLQTIVNIALLGGLIGFLIMKGHRRSSKAFMQITGLVMAIWFCNMAFSILASPIVLRYQIFAMVVTFAPSLLFIEYIYNSDEDKKHIPVVFAS